MWDKEQSTKLSTVHLSTLLRGVAQLGFSEKVVFSFPNQGGRLSQTGWLGQIPNFVRKSEMGEALNNSSWWFWNINLILRPTLNCSFDIAFGWVAPIDNIHGGQKFPGASLLREVNRTGRKTKSTQEVKIWKGACPFKGKGTFPILRKSYSNNKERWKKDACPLPSLGEGQGGISGSRHTLPFDPNC